VVEPIIAIAFVTAIPDDHVQFPGGTITESPTEAEFIVAWTSANEQLAALCVTAFSSEIQKKQIDIIKITEQASALLILLTSKST
jgi:hypothetical protein